MATFSGLDDTPGYTENGGLTVLDNDATIVNAATFNGATLTLARQGGANPNDVFDSERCPTAKPSSKRIVRALIFSAPGN